MTRFRTALVLAGLIATLTASIAGQSATSTRRGVTLSGRIVDAYPGAAPQPDAVLVTRFGSGTMTEKIPIGPDRTFAIENALPGQYMLQASYSLDATTLWVGGSDVSDIVLTVTGQVRVPTTLRVDDGSETPQYTRLRVFFRSDRSSSGPFGGQFPLNLPPGTWPVFIGAPPGYFVRSVSSNGVDLLDAPLQVVASGPQPSLDVVLTRTPPTTAPTATVSGVLPGSSDVDVELMTDGFMGARRIVGSGTTDVNGGFTFADVPAGVYALNVPPAGSVVTGVVVYSRDVRVEVPVADGTRVFAGASVRVHRENDQMPPAWPGLVSLVAEQDGVQHRFRIEPQGFWGAIAPGAYRITIDGLTAGYTIRSLTAGSVNLLERPFVVPADRPAEVVVLSLDYVE